MLSELAWDGITELISGLAGCSANTVLGARGKTVALINKAPTAKPAIIFTGVLTLNHFDINFFMTDPSVRFKFSGLVVAALFWIAFIGVLISCFSFVGFKIGFRLIWPFGIRLPVRSLIAP